MMNQWIDVIEISAQDVTRARVMCLPDGALRAEWATDEVATLDLLPGAFHFPQVVNGTVTLPYHASVWNTLNVSHNETDRAKKDASMYAALEMYHARYDNYYFAAARRLIFRTYAPDDATALSNHLLDAALNLRGSLHHSGALARFWREIGAADQHTITRAYDFLAAFID